MAIEHTYHGLNGETVTKSLTPITAIRAQCVHCMQSLLEPKNCTSQLCPLYPFRTGDAHSGKVWNGKGAMAVDGTY